MTTYRSIRISSAVAAALLGLCIAGCHLPPIGAPPSAQGPLKEHSLMSSHGPVGPRCYGHISNPMIYGYQAPCWYPWPTHGAAYQESFGKSGAPDAGSGQPTSPPTAAPNSLPIALPPAAPKPLDAEILPLPQGTNAEGPDGGLDINWPSDDHATPPAEPPLTPPAEPPLTPPVETPAETPLGDSVDPFLPGTPVPEITTPPIGPSPDESSALPKWRRLAVAPRPLTIAPLPTPDAWEHVEFTAPASVRTSPLAKKLTATLSSP